jgi:hypothetical protein
MNELVYVTVVNHKESNTTFTVTNNSTFVSSSSYPTTVQITDSSKTTVTINDLSVKVSSALILNRNYPTDPIDYENIYNKPILGTSSQLSYNDNGNALPNQVVIGNDTRLTDSRNPLPHSHYIEDVTSLSSSIDSVVNALAFTSSCWTSFNAINFNDYSSGTNALQFSIDQQSNNTNLLEINENENSIILKGLLKSAFLGVLSGEAVQSCQITVDLVDYHTEETISSFTKTINAGRFYFSQSLQYESFSRLSSTKTKINVSVTEESMLNFTAIDFTVIVNNIQDSTDSPSNFILETTNPMLITDGFAEIGYYVNGGVVMNSAIVFLDLSENDFDNSGKLLYNRDYLVEDHFGVTVIGSKLQLPLHLDGKYAVVSYVK